MADPITDERLREIVENTYCLLDEGQILASELLAARARIKSLEGCIVRNMEAAIRRIPKAGAARCDPVMAALAQASQERDAARAEVERLRNHIDSAGTGFKVALGAIRLSLEQADKDRDALRADLREAMELLDMAEAPPDHENGGDLELWNRRRAVLRGVVEKHKETP